MTWDESRSKSLEWPRESGLRFFEDDKTKGASVTATYLFGFYVAEHGDLFFDRVLQRGGTATHDLWAKVR